MIYACRFTGKPYSSATGLYYYFQRWYDASTGRFLSPDPLPGRLSDPQSQNAYLYVRNIPTTLTDPAGLVECEGPSAYCEGPRGGAMDAAQRDPTAICTDDPRACALCADNPLFHCEYTDPMSRGSMSGNGDPGVTADTGTSSGYSPPPDPPTVTALDTTSTIEPIDATDMTTVRHYTTWEGRAGITQSGAINPSRGTGLVYVTEPSQVEGLTTPEEIGNRLGISPEKGVTYYEFQYPSEKLVNLPLTSGGAIQFGIREPVVLVDVGGIWWPLVEV